MFVSKPILKDIRTTVFYILSKILVIFPKRNVNLKKKTLKRCENKFRSYYYQMIWPASLVTIPLSISWESKPIQYFSLLSSRV